MPSTIPAKAAKLIEDGAVKIVPDARIYTVKSGPAIYKVTIHDDTADDAIDLPPVDCDCPAGERGQWCSHAQAVQDLEAQTPARTRAFDAASSALRTLWAIVDDEDLGGDEGARTALLEALDSFDIAENIDKEWRNA